VTLEWTNGATDYDGIDVLRDGVLLVSLAGDATTTSDLDRPDGTYTYTVTATRFGFDSAAVTCDVTVATATAAVTDLTCTVTGDEVTLAWVNGADDYDLIEIRRGGELLAELEGDATSTVDTGVLPGEHEYAVVPVRDTLEAAAVECVITIEDVGILFRRGDAEGNGSVFALTDALYLLQWAFDGGDAPQCLDAADADDNSVVFALTDALYLLQWAFGDGDAPPAPGVGECGTDPTDDSLGCETPPDCG
jgi:hypothetical protein